MAIFERIADILKANVNDLIDKAEDPEKMVKQLIIEMEEQVEEATRSLGQAMGSQKVAAKELSDAMAEAADWNDKAKLALKAGNEMLAKKALDCKVGIDTQIAGLQESYNQITAQVDKLKEQVDQLRLKLNEARSRQNVLIARAKVADAMTAAATSVKGIDVDSAFAKLDAMERKVAEKEGTAEAFTELNVADLTLSDDFAQLEHAAAVDDELARLKGELGL